MSLSYCATALLLAAAAAGVGAQPSGFLLLTAPRNGKVSFLRLPDSGNFSGLQPETLIDEGLRHPQGVAVDKRRQRLYVADPDVQKIYGYQLYVRNGDLMTDGRQVVVAEGAESRWVAVDGSGTVFFSDEPNNRILKVSADRALRGDTTPEVVYSGDSAAEVNEPGGVAVDNFHVFWTNKHFGTQAGSLVRGSESPLAGAAPELSISVLAKNSVKSYGVCIAMGNVFFTDSEKSLYGVKKQGGPVAEVSNIMDRPRGCAWDGDGTVYVADRGAGAVYSFASNMHIISRAQLKRSFAFEDAFGLAFFSKAMPMSYGGITVIALMLAVAVGFL